MHLVWDRDAPHLVERVVLADPGRLYAFTGRTPAAEVLAAALRALDQTQVATEPARQLLRDLGTAWSQGRKLIGLGPGDLDRVRALVGAAEAAFTELEAPVPLRTRSARLLGDSKALERAIPSLLAYLREAGLIGRDLARDDALAQLGLTKYAQPVLAAGPLIVGDVDIGGWPYAGLPPELLGGVRPSRPLRTILTIENLESFNRHVRSCKRPGDVVIYTGGFPALSVLTLLRVIVGLGCEVVHHWGDIDPGGIRIGRHLETSLGVAIVPHFMDADLAHRLGRPAEANQLAPALPVGSAFFNLASYLQQPEALWLEQEVIDPKEVCFS